MEKNRSLIFNQIYRQSITPLPIFPKTVKIMGYNSVWVIPKMSSQNFKLTYTVIIHIKRQSNTINTYIKKIPFKSLQI